MGVDLQCLMCGVGVAVDLQCDWSRRGRGQRSRPYLISFNEKIRRAVTLNRKQTLAFVEA